MLELSLKEQKQINGGGYLYLITAFKNGKIYSTSKTSKMGDVASIKEHYLFNENCDKVNVTTIRV
ncbi:hypothetical protein FDB41_10060 [Clostridium botulinum]|nr:hypothetical protein [Clostridium botulinum]NFO53895.1 hypothetical protein [Clostridium botulinum]